MSYWAREGKSFKVVEQKYYQQITAQPTLPQGNPSTTANWNTSTGNRNVLTTVNQREQSSPNQRSGSANGMSSSYQQQPMKSQAPPYSQGYSRQITSFLTHRNSHEKSVVNQ